MERGRYSRSGALSDLMLLKIAWRQKIVICCIVANICIYLVIWLVPEPFKQIVSWLRFIVVIVSIVAVFRLALIVENGWRGTVYGVLTLIPIVGIIVLLLANQKAVQMLADHRVPVHFLGVPFSWINKQRALLKL